MEACLEYLRENGADPAIVIDPHTVITAPWPRLRCQFGCESYGHNHCCPPEAPDYTRTRAVLDSYSTAILFRIHHYGASRMAWECARRLFLEGCGIDVFATARAHGLEIHTLREVGEEHSHFGLILVE